MNRRLIAIFTALWIVTAAIPFAMCSEYYEEEYEEEEYYDEDDDGGGYGNGSTWWWWNDDTIDEPSFTFFIKPKQEFELPLYGDLRELLSGVYLEGNAMIYSDAVTYETVVENFAVNWNYDDVDITTPGLYEITYDVELTGVFEGEEPDTKVTVIVYDPNGAPVISVASVYWKDIKKIIPLGMDYEALDTSLNAFMQDYCYGYAGTAYLETSDSRRIEFCGWDSDRIDTSTPGVYYPLLTKLPPGVDTTGLEYANIPVYVMETNDVTMRHFELFNNCVIVEWIKWIAEPELWMSMDGGALEPAPDECGYFHLDETNVLVINFYPLKSGHVYDFEIRYENGGVSVDSLRLDCTGDSVTCEPFTGDRTGERRDEQELPQEIPDDEAGEKLPIPTPEPEPTSTSKPTPLPEPVYFEPVYAEPVSPTPDPIPSAAPEQYSPEPQVEVEENIVASTEPDTLSITVSGEELSVLIAANPEYVTFIEDDLRVSVPAGALDSLVLGSGDSLAVIVKETDGDDARVAFEISGEEIEWSSDETVLIDVLSDSQSVIPAVAVDEEEPQPSAPAQNRLPLLIATTGFVGLSGVGAFAVIRIKVVRR